MKPLAVPSIFNPPLKDHTMSLPIKSLLTLAIATLPLAVVAASHSGGAPMAANPGAPAAATAGTTSTATSADLTAAEVRKVDKAGGKLTLKHEAIKNLDMPGMTMVFQVKDQAVLDTLKAGDKVKFRATQESGRYTVTEIQPDK